jgi:hypothetical protein
MITPGGIAPVRHLVGCAAQDPLPGLHGWISTALSVMLIPGTDLLAEITTSNPAVQRQWQLVIAVFNGVKSDAAAAVDHKRLRNGRRRAGRQAALAMAAEGRCWLIGLERDSREEMS